MEFMPEYNSSSLLKAVLANTKQSNENNVQVESSHKSSSHFYLLDELLNNNGSDIDSVSIRAKLLDLFKQKPERFVSFEMQSNAFNCLNKQRGYYRDPINCSKYYYCEGSNQLIQHTVSYTCLNGGHFNMNGCFCDTHVTTELCQVLENSFCGLRN